MTTALMPGQFFVEFMEELGSGGLGRVNRVRVTTSYAESMPVGSEWAAKRLNDKWRQHPEAQARFEREVRTLSAMSHANIVSCVGVSLPGYERFYMMPLYRDSVRRLIARQGNRGDWRRIATYGAILADALHYAHGIGAIHRDTKPDNILFNPGEPLVIADWGIGYFIHKQSVVLQQLTRGGMGTEYYCSREQWLTGKCDARGDIYSLGMTLDEWLNSGRRQILIGAGLGNGTAMVGSVGARSLRELLVTMTQVLAANRPASMAAVARDLRVISSMP
jgi:serine/threonine-protein kinase